MKNIRPFVNGVLTFTHSGVPDLEIENRVGEAIAAAFCAGQKSQRLADRSKFALEHSNDSVIEPKT